MENSPAFYKTRWFWTVSFLLIFIFNIFLLAPTISSVWGVLNAIIWAVGGAFVYAIYATVVNNPPSADLVVALISVPAVIYLLREAIGKNGVSIKYSMAMLSLLIVNSLVVLLVYSSF